MEKYQLYPIGNTDACRYAVDLLKANGFEIVDHPTPEVTHLILDVPSFAPNGMLRGGGTVERVLETLPPYITVVGGNLDHPLLEGYRKIDLLQDPFYLAENARITAECAIKIAAPLLSTTLSQSPALVIGWGRIGKCLGQILKALGNRVTIAARNPADRAMIQALGYQAIDAARIQQLSSFRILFNTAPAQVLTKDQLRECRNCVKIDLASKKGLDSEDTVWARGLPGIHAPETSGNLIARTFLRLMKEEK